MGSCHLRPPVFAMPSDASLPIIDLAWRLVLEVSRDTIEELRAACAGEEGGADAGGGAPSWR